MACTYQEIWEYPGIPFAKMLSAKVDEAYLENEKFLTSSSWASEVLCESFQ